MTVRNATELLLLIENTLGWVPPTNDRTPMWKARTIHAGRINKKIKENPKLYTWDNLELAVEYLRRKRQHIKGPLGIFYAIEPALKLANEKVERPIGELVDEALAVEYARGDDPVAKDWIGRLMRGFGSARLEVYQAWRDAGRDA